MSCLNGGLPWVATNIVHVSKSADWNDPFQIRTIDNSGSLIVTGAVAEAGAQKIIRGRGVDLRGWLLTMIVEPEFGFSTLITTFVSRSPTTAPDGISLDEPDTGFGRFICPAARLAGLPLGEWRFRLIRSKGPVTANVTRGPFFVHA